MESKDKQIRELEGDKILLIVGIIVLGLLGLGFSIHSDIKENNLESQLQSCQEQKGFIGYFNITTFEEKVPVWTLKIECFNLRGKWINQENYTEINNCLYFKDVAESWGCKIIKNCEVLK